MRRTSSAFVLALVVTASARSAHADAKACIAASERGQSSRTDGKLTVAKAAFAECAADACPTAIRKECATALTDIDAALPTIVLGAKIGTKDAVVVHVSVDGIKVTDSLDGRAVPIDPGSHVFHFETDGQPPIDKTVLIKQGEKNRSVSAEWGGAATSAPAGDANATAIVNLSGKTETVLPVLEVRHGSRWTLACSAPCEQPMPLAGTYRINGTGVVMSAPFTLLGQPGEHVSVGVREGDDGGKKTAILVSAAGGAAIVVGAVLMITTAFINYYPKYPATLNTTLGTFSCPATAYNGPNTNSDGTRTCTDYHPGIGYALAVTGGIVAAGGIATLIAGLVMLANGHADVTQTKIGKLVGPDGFAF